MANFPFGTRRDIVRDLSPDLLKLLGFIPWSGYGATGDPSADMIAAGEDLLGELKPKASKG